MFSLSHKYRAVMGLSCSDVMSSVLFVRECHKTIVSSKLVTDYSRVTVE